MEKQIPAYYRVNDRISTAAQPEAAAFPLLKERGFDAVINLSPRSTPNYLAEEAEITEKSGLDYIHYPVDCSNLQDKHYRIFSGILKGLGDAKVLVHCGGNIKSSNLVHMYNVLEDGVKEEDSLKQLLDVQQPEVKWYEYFRSFGMKGISH